MKELLAELAMVDDEIGRLESQISHLQTELNHEKEATKESKYKQWLEGNQNPYRYSSLPPFSNSLIKGVNERMSVETKTLHFISKAIKGDYDLNDFYINERLRSSRAFPSDQKENHIHGTDGFQEKVSRKSAILKPPSPLREPRHPTPKVRASTRSFAPFEFV